ncbi:hypothetical protein EMCG_01278 [[Emmonsia] crescens]|uniref:Uncharacterized protein n=1 Tax=[Emmonsia] crescens TaxID=73230 RepID=A0A0G2I529_9EURO|nr:hypothetical protein EMCG_01278 [Emmonsia crescens UAMH 3008]
MFMSGTTRSQMVLSSDLPAVFEGILNINNRISLPSQSSKASGELSSDDGTVAFTHKLFAWRPCNVEASDGSNFKLGSSNSTVMY